MGPLREAVDLINAGEGNWRQLSGLGEVGPTPDQGLGGHNQHMHLGCLHLKGRGLWTLPGWMPATTRPRGPS